MREIIVKICFTLIWTKSRKAVKCNKTFGFTIPERDIFCFVGRDLDVGVKIKLHSRINLGEFDSTLSCRSLLPGQVNARRWGRKIFYRARDVLDLLFEDAAPPSVGGESTTEYIRVDEKVKSGQKTDKFGQKIQVLPSQMVYFEMSPHVGAGGGWGGAGEYRINFGIAAEPGISRFGRNPWFCSQLFILVTITEHQPCWSRL